MINPPDRTTVLIQHTEDGETYAELVTCSQAALDAVLFSFNPSGDLAVTTIKALSAGLIQLMFEHQNKTQVVAQARAAAIAITQLELAQMAAVKALFAK